MAGKKLHCLFGIKDDLHEFAEAAINTLPLCAMNAPLTWCQDFGSVQAGILHRDDNFQIELIVVQPNVWIPEHVHPGTDTIEYPISGHVRFVINGQALFDGYDDDRFLSFSKGKGDYSKGDAPRRLPWEKGTIPGSDRRNRERSRSRRRSRSRDRQGRKRSKS